MALSVDQARPFFEYAREREAIRIRREVEGLPRPWTKDEILNTYKFCNIYREDDATTRWFRTHVRDRLSGTPEVILATVLFRWFNRASTGDAVFRQIGDYNREGGPIRTAFEQYLHDGRIESIHSAIKTFCGNGPYVTGSYIIKSPDGMNKLDGVLESVDAFNCNRQLVQHIPRGWAPQKDEMGWRQLGERILSGASTISLEQFWSWLKKFAFMGTFTSYEVVTDLRHTNILRSAPDIMTWANAGPGAVRGLNRIHRRKLTQGANSYSAVCEMRELLEMANGPFLHVWPTREGQPTEMRDIEHTLCEFDKYERARLGEGRPRGTLK